MQVEISSQVCDKAVSELKGHISDKTLAYLNRHGIQTIRDFLQVQNDVPQKISTEVKAYLMLGIENFYN